MAANGQAWPVAPHSYSPLPTSIILNVLSSRQVHIRLLRLKAQTTDILVSLCRAVSPSTNRQVSPADVDADAETIAALVRSLEIEDWGLFG